MIGSHAEAIQLHFDPTELGYAELLDLFWSRHDPTSSSNSQYRAQLFCEDTGQETAAQASAARLQEVLGAPIATPITRGQRFYSAEAYHQKWYLRRHPTLLAEVQARYPSEPDLLASTDAAKLNAYVGDPKARDRLKPALAQMDLSQAARDHLRSLPWR